MTAAMAPKRPPWGAATSIRTPAASWPRRCPQEIEGQVAKGPMASSTLFAENPQASSSTEVSPPAVHEHAGQDGGEASIGEARKW